MKKLLSIIAITLTTITITGCTNSSDQELNEEPITIQEEDSILLEENTESIDVITSSNDQDNYGSLSALEQESFTIEEMLVYALQDEYAARAEYIYIMETYQVDKPFSNIKQSEETHIDLLLPLFESYQLLPIEDTSSEHLFEITSLQEAFEIGVIAEINNIAMYNLFLEDESLPDDLVDAFTKLRDASINHLAAFEKNANK
jgi:hypothetical protein